MSASHDQYADLVIEVDEPGVMRLVRQLELEFYVSEEAAREAVRLERMFNAIHLATGFKVDLVIKKDRPFSEAELARRTRGTLAGRQVSFASAEDTILAKLEWSRTTGSDRQYADALGIIQLHDTALDWNHLERWADDLGVRGLLDRARRGDPA
jgi:hypothetical protein